MTVIDYESIEEVSLDTAGWEYSWASTIPWVNSPMIDASTSVSNIPESDVILEWTLNVVRGWTNTVNFSSVNENTVDWSEWSLTMPDWTVYTIAAGTTWIMTVITYIYLDVNESETTLQLTTTSWDSVGEDKLLVCVAKNQDAPKYAVYQNFWTNTQDVFITADNIASNSITANEMQVNSLSALSADLWYITSWTITLDSAGHIKSGQTNYNAGVGFFLWVSWWKPTFSIKWNSWQYIAFNWDTISLNVPIAYSAITGTPTIPTLPSYIKSTYIDSTTIQSPTISAGSITGTTITGWTFKTSGENKRIEIRSDNTIRFYYDSSQISTLYWWELPIYNWTRKWLFISWHTMLWWNLYPLYDGSYDIWWTTQNRRRDIYMSWIVKFSNRISLATWSEAVQNTAYTSNAYLNIYITDTNWIRKTYKLLLRT